MLYAVDYAYDLVGNRRESCADGNNLAGNRLTLTNISTYELNGNRTNKTDSASSTDVYDTLHRLVNAGTNGASGFATSHYYRTRRQTKEEDSPNWDSTHDLANNHNLTVPRLALETAGGAQAVGGAPLIAHRQHTATVWRSMSCSVAGWWCH